MAKNELIIIIKFINFFSCTSEYYQQPIIDDILKQRKRLTKDEKVARDEGIDKFISVDQIINMELSMNVLVK